ncbi:Mismatch repair protein msh3 [Malassezia cuniculi]|uniref:MutS protein homolog 3 n=1 Tax=Malassezia cuniculi TaxID=948313 RepID=A0AAF0ER62_9BASI|nr:Mismatch repair protein msh3 [Malassezia cuniculi]
MQQSLDAFLRARPGDTAGGVSGASGPEETQSHPRKRQKVAAAAHSARKRACSVAEKPVGSGAQAEARAAPPKYTPLEKQILALKRQHAGMMLAFEVGYKLKFYGDDANTASQLLGIACTTEKNLPAAMIPVPRLSVHIKRLVGAGHKVGVVRQTETRAIKAVSDNANAPFIRELCEVYTAATWVDELDVADASATEQVLVALVEHGNSFGLVAIDVATAAITYDSFTDGHLRTCALAYIINYLNELGLADAFATRTNYRPFADRTSMLLSSNTIRDLELLQNATDKRVHGSLLWLLDQCSTPMGRRVLRRWIRRPLLDLPTLHRRQDAVSIMRNPNRPALLKAIKLLCRLPDLERGLARLVYGRITSTELATVLLSLYRISHEIERVESPSQYGTGSAMIDEALAALSVPREAISAALNAINIEEARHGNLKDMFRDPNRYPEIAAAKQVLAEDEVAFAAELEQIRKTLKRPNLNYFSVSGIDHLVEMRLSDARKAPADWVRVNSTKISVRFHTPTVISLTKQRDVHLEELNAAGKRAYGDFCRHVADNSHAIKQVIDALGLLDVLSSLGKVARQPGYTCPTVDMGPSRIVLDGFRHPMSEALITGTYVPNKIELGGPNTPAVLLTGANMGGKSSTVRAIALVVVLAHIGSFVPCDAAEMSCHDSIATRMGAYDNMFRGKSTFLVEAEETAQILRTCTSRTLVILDEFGRGTSTLDGTALAYAVLQSLLERGTIHCPHLLFITHYTTLGTLSSRFPNVVRNMHMATLESGDGDVENLNVVFLHELRDGLAAQSLGIHVAALVGMPRNVIEKAIKISKEQREHDEEMAKRRKAARYARMLQAVYLSPGIDALVFVSSEASDLRSN